MPVSLIQVDAFTKTAFKGNPAAVCVLDQPQQADWMQALAAEMNLSETAFLWPVQNGYSLRWFTPVTEVDLCGHATIASAHAMWSEGIVASDRDIAFQTRSGTLSAKRDGEWIQLDFPATPVDEREPEPELLQALNVDAKFYGKTKFDRFVEVESEQCLRSLEPDFLALAATATRGIIVTSRSDTEEFDFVSRFFAPAAGINEDPVTGSAHCALAPYWADRLVTNAMIGYQASKRGGVVRVEARGERVMLSGQAITVMKAQLEC